MTDKLNILGIVGSLRKGSYNKALLRAAIELAPVNTEIEIVEINDLPLYNQDLENPLPLVVVELKEKIKNSDAIILVTPEYNYSVSGVLKNVLDWGSRPYGNNSFDGKPTAIMGASPGMLGTARAQYHLRQILQSLNMYTLNRPEVMVSNAAKKFDESLRLIDEPTREKVKQQLEALVIWTQKLK